MILKNFFTMKMETISSFIEDNAEQLDADKDFRAQVKDRLRKWVILASVASSDKMTIGELIHEIKRVDLKGVLKIGIAASEKIIVLKTEGTKYSPRINEEIIDPEKTTTFFTIARFMDEFDATIEGIL